MAVLRTVSNVPFFFCEVWNNNRRYYPREVAVKKILSPKIMKYMENKQLYGEINHPADRVGTDFDYVSHVITNMYYDEDKKAIIGTYDVLDTPRGRVLNTLLEYGCNVGISARALGKGRKTPEGEVVDADSYVFKTFDVVANPGFENATVLSESESELQQSLRLIYESLDDEGRESLDSLFDTFYEDVIDSSSQDSSDEESLHSYEERAIDLEFELNYYKDLYEETQFVQSDSLRKENRELRLLNSDLKDKMVEFESAMEDSQSVIDKQKNTIKRLLESLNEVKRERDSLENMYEELKLSTVAKETYESSTSLNEALGEESESLRHLLECKQSMLVQQAQEIKRLEMELTTSRDEHAKTKGELTQLKEDVNESLKPKEVKFNLVGVKDKKSKAHAETLKLYESLNK